MFFAGERIWIWSHHHYVLTATRGRPEVVASEVWHNSLLPGESEAWLASSSPFRTFRQSLSSIESVPVPGPTGLRPIAGSITFGALRSDALDLFVVRRSAVSLVGKLPAVPGAAHGVRELPGVNPDALVPPLSALRGQSLVWAARDGRILESSLVTGQTTTVAVAPGITALAVEGDLTAWVDDRGVVTTVRGTSAPHALGTHAALTHAIALTGGRLVVLGAGAGLVELPLDDGAPRPVDLPSIANADGPAKAAVVSMTLAADGALYTMTAGGKIASCQ